MQIAIEINPVIIAIIFGLPIFIVKHLEVSKVLQYENPLYCNFP